PVCDNTAIHAASSLMLVQPVPYQRRNPMARRLSDSPFLSASHHTLTACSAPAPSQAGATTVPSSGVASLQTSPLPNGSVVATACCHAASSSAERVPLPCAPARI